MQIVDKPYSRGIYCHAPSHVVVRLPGPGKTFSAVVGVDSNDQTRPGRGSVVFSVEVGRQSRRTSGQVMREGMPGVPISVDLGGATEFALRVSDSGDGISCDQSDWADAKVVLADGKTVWLGDLPLVDPPAEPFTKETPFSFTYDGKPSAELLPTWTCRRDARKLDDRRTERTVTWTDPEDRPGRPLRGDRVPRFPHGRMDGLLQEHGQGRHADPGEHPGPGRFAAAARRRGVPAAPRGRVAVGRHRLRAAGNRARTPAPRSASARPAGGRPTATGPTSISSGATAARSSSSAGPANGPPSSLATRARPSASAPARS